MAVDWTDENEALVRELWRKGFSASHIATQIPGATRNAIIGKVHRFGEKRLPRARAAFKPVTQRAQRRPARVASFNAPPMRKVDDERKLVVADYRKTLPPRVIEFSGGEEAVHRTLYLSARQGQCKFIFGDIREVGLSGLFVCGAPAPVGSSWCAKHHHELNIPVQKKERNV